LVVDSEISVAALTLPDWICHANLTVRTDIREMLTGAGADKKKPAALPQRV
jgi:hypothetical protein